MADFQAANVLREVDDRGKEIAAGQRLVPALAAITAVLAALATLFAHHSSVLALSQKNEAVLLQTKAMDKYNYFESKRIKAQLIQALIDADISAPVGRRKLEQSAARESSDANTILNSAHAFEGRAGDAMDQSQHYIGSYQSYEVSATLFQVSVILVSITALTRTKLFMYMGLGASVIGLVFLTVGLLH